MGLEDFNKINTDEDIDVKKEDKKKSITDEVKLESVEYYLSHIDELIECMRKSYYDYINAKLRYEFKKNDYQTSINWTDENALRKANNLPKITTQDQRNAVINLRTKKLNDAMKTCEVKYKFYNKMFDFISKNYELLSSPCNCKISIDDILNEIDENK